MCRDESNATEKTAPTVLVIRDGWGHNPHAEQDPWNAIHEARTPVADRLMTDWPTTLVKTSGEDVGLPSGTMGNSEVGHQNIGAGRIVEQELLRINRAAERGFDDVDAFSRAFDHIESSGGALHLLGLASDGRVHSDIAHLEVLIDLAARRGIASERLFVHAITDGRDTSPREGEGFVERIESALRRAGVGRVATVVGRYWAMDRDHRWQRVARAYAALTGNQDHPKVETATDAATAVGDFYEQTSDENRRGDEFVTPTLVTDDSGSPIGPIRDGDAVVFFNFRGDRPREISKAFLLDDASWADVQEGGFDRGDRLENLYFVGMTRYEEDLPLSAVAFEKPPKMPDILGDVVAAAGLTQLRCAETEKYPHVTFFMNDYRDQPFDGEHRALLPSPQDVTTYDQKPEMSAEAVRDAVLDRLAEDDCEALIVVNFANPDMVGHTGNHAAIVRAVEVVDACVGQIVEATLARGGALVVTADHGNAEQTWDPENDCPHTAHTTYDVPLHLIGTGHEHATLRRDGRLADIAPTLLALMGLDPPESMTGRSLIEESPR